jgi:hypothetical protein
MGRANFDVLYPKTGQKLMKISLRGYPQFHFTIGGGGGNPSRLFVEEAPGAVLKKETTGALEINDVLHYLHGWARRLPDEIEAEKGSDQDLERLLARLESEIEEHVPNPDAHFAPREIADLRTRLESLGQRFEQMQKENSITKTELAELKRLITQSSKDLPALPKATWYRAAVSKIVTVLRKIVGTKEGREFIASAAKKLIGIE